MQGHLNSDLSKVGMNQIKALGEWMKKVSFDHIYSSDSMRAELTAKSITNYTEHLLKSDIRIREKNLGVFEGLTSDEAKEKYPEMNLVLAVQEKNINTVVGERLKTK